MLFLNKHQSKHLKTKPLSFKIILLIIIIKPFINTLEEFDFPGLPFTILEVLGALIFLLVIVGILTTKNKQTTSTPIYIFKLFFIIYLANMLFIQISNPTFYTFAIIIKVITPSLMFFYFARIINDESDLDLVLTSFLISAIPLIIISIYDINIIGNYTYTRGNIPRIDSSFGDIVTIGLHLNIIYAIILYKLFFGTWLGKKKLIFLSTYIIFALFFLSKINHATSFGVFAVLTIIYVIFSIPERTILVFSRIVFLSFLVYYFFGDWIINFYERFFLMEYNRVISDAGTFDNTMSFHGRAGRWLRMFTIFIDQSRIRTLFGGMGIDYLYVIGHGPHNDFLRILLTTGFVGLTSYLLFILSIIKKAFSKELKFKFLAILSLSILLLYSVTSTPSIYIDLNLFLLPVFMFLLR